MALRQRTSVTPASVARWIFEPALQHRRALLWLNVLYFGVLVLATIVVAVNPQIQQALLEAVGQAFSPQGGLGPLVDAYRSGRIASAILLTFLVNLILGSFLYITLPSLFLPFWGVFFGLIRASLWGILFSPFAGNFDGTIIPHVLTLIIEGEAYVLAMLGVWLWWAPVIRGHGRRWHAWLAGVRLQPRIYLMVTVLLITAAVYEVLEIVLLIPWLGGGR